ncbi:MAG: hypothetical protein IJ078_05385 [Succinivibrionaceae bacterium]|nr:hypothetical protein [Succinivibrionaceae bacterium]
MRERIKNIVIDEFSKLTGLIETDFQSNFRRKVNNFLLSQMDERITASMVFVSSFESKSGFAIETCAKRIARLKFGEENVPAIVNPRNLQHDIDVSTVTGQVVVTDVDTHNGDLRGEIAAFRANNEARGMGKSRVESGVTMENVKRTLLPLSSKYKTDKIYTKPVDLAFFDGNNWNIMELKAGGDLDSSNAPSNVEKLLTIYVDMGIENCNAFFSTLYNKDGEGNVWKGAVKKHLHYPSMFLIGADFWNRILPDGITFTDFAEIYREALEEIDLNSRINRMISNCIEE